jgi:hypothetical protein
MMFHAKGRKDFRKGSQSDLKQAEARKGPRLREDANYCISNAGEQKYYVSKSPKTKAPRFRSALNK